MLQAYFAGQTVDAKAIGKKLLGRDIEEHAAKKSLLRDEAVEHGRQAGGKRYAAHEGR